MKVKVNAARQAALDAVDPDFLVPAARHVMHIRGPVSLRISRVFNDRSTKTVAGVRSERVRLPGTAGARAVIHRPVEGAPDRGALLWIFGGGLISGSAAHVNDIALPSRETSV